ncbi:tetratricopeptide repeat protein [Desmospora profundinema]|uniref:Tetratricopeptide (TPR) repeat protein n=1 Tax=Desmospora profundinema TaxID=1571184 RepID=A0ABU1IRG2_9BACL|nr:tetratricopeptide repeat protein [Desmospora profundinema]MDR6226330.1 tetratricopeptide (TPR) repeat protein [Desmospora profundinema]
MSVSSIHEIGEIIRKVRKERGLRLEDLADENISPATISNIERGVSHVSPDKAMYLLKKLDLSIDKIPEMMLQEQKDLEKIKFRMLGIEVTISTGEIDEAIGSLNEFNLEENHPYAATMHYLKGKSYRLKQNWKRAERSYYKAIQLSSQRFQSKNIEAISFLELGVCCHFQNDLEKALQFTESAMDAFVENGERQYLKYLLFMNKAIYLERLGRCSESLSVVDKVWSSRDKIKQSSVLLTFYWLRAELNRKLKQHDQSIEFATEGLDLARLNQQYNLMFDLWTVLGNVYLDLDKLEESEYCFDQVLLLRGRNVEEDKFITAYSSLGLLHMIQMEWEKAEDSIKKAIEVGEKFNDAPRLDNALQIMGDFYCKQEKTEEAIKFYNRSLELARRHGYKKREYVALYRLAKCWEGRNEQEFQKYTANMYTVQKELEELGVKMFDETK